MSKWGGGNKLVSLDQIVCCYTGGKIIILLSQKTKNKAIEKYSYQNSSSKYSNLENTT